MERVNKFLKEKTSFENNEDDMLEKVEEQEDKISYMEQDVFKQYELCEDMYTFLEDIAIKELRKEFKNKYPDYTEEEIEEIKERIIADESHDDILTWANYSILEDYLDDLEAYQKNIMEREEARQEEIAEYYRINGDPADYRNS